MVGSLDQSSSNLRANNPSSSLIECEPRAAARRQHHQTHDALAVDLFAIFFDQNVALESVGRLDEQRGGAGMNAKLVDDGQLFFDFRRTVAAGLL
jgi:hypothetical protein